MYAWLVWLAHLPRAVRRSLVIGVALAVVVAVLAGGAHVVRRQAYAAGARAVRDSVLTAAVIQQRRVLAVLETRADSLAPALDTAPVVRRRAERFLTRLDSLPRVHVVSNGRPVPLTGVDTIVLDTTMYLVPHPVAVVLRVQDSLLYQVVPQRMREVLDANQRLGTYALAERTARLAADSLITLQATQLLVKPVPRGVPWKRLLLAGAAGYALARAVR